MKLKRQKQTPVGDLFSNMKRLYCIGLVFILLFSFSFCVFADNEADINKDSFVDIRDVIVMKKMILNKKHYETKENVDIVENTGIGDYNAVDLTNLVAYIIGAVDTFTHYDSMDEL